MRKLNTNKNEHTEVFAVDERGPGGANHIYEIHSTDKAITKAIGHWPERILFQNGPIKESGVNGIQNEDLIAIVIDRLQGFQGGDFDCLDNQCAIVHLRAALTQLQNRTKEREKRGVEGTSAI